MILRSNHIDFVLSKMVPAIAADGSGWRESIDVDGLVIRTADGADQVDRPLQAGRAARALAPGRS